MLVSVVIPTYNVEAYIEECVHSVLQQHYQSLEIILVDNNSTDQTVTKIRKLQKEYPQLLFLQEKQQGAPNARNSGLAAARGEWIQFLDADDLLDPRKIGHQVQLIRENADQACSLVCSTVRFQSIDGSMRVVTPVPDAFKGLFDSGLGTTSSSLWNAQMVRQAGGWNTALRSSQEYDLMFRIIQANPAIITDVEPFTTVRARAAGQISRSDPKPKWEQYIRLRLQILEYLQTQKPDYFQTHRQWYLEKLIAKLLILLPYNPAYVHQLFKKHVKKGLKISAGPGISKPYAQTFNRLGYVVANRLFLLKMRFLNNHPPE